MNWSISVMPWLIEEQGEDGTYLREVYFVVAVDAAGRRFAHFKQFYVADEAWKLAGKVEKAEALNPECSEYWTELQPVYGSDAYQSAGGDRAFDRVTDLAAMGNHQAAELEAQHEDEISNYLAKRRA